MRDDHQPSDVGKPSFQESLRLLHESEARLPEAQRIALMGSCEWDIKTGAITWSEGLYQIYGRDSQIFTPTNENILQHMLPEVREEVLRIRERVFREKKQSFELHIRIRRADGDLRYLHNRNIVIYNEAGEPVRLLGISQDKTELRLAEAQTVRKVEQLAALNEMGQVAVANLELNLILPQVGEKMRALLRADCILLLLLRQEDQHLHIEGVSGKGLSHLQGSEIPLTANLVRTAVQANKAILVQSAEEVARHASFLQAKESGESIKAMLAAPLRFQGRLLGLVLAIHHQEDGFALHDLFVLDTAAAWISIAINNASLYQTLSLRELRLRELAEQLIREQEAERQRTAHELHDEAGQTLTALKWKLEMVMADLDDSSLRLELTQAADLMTQVIERIRHLAYDLRPPELDIVGLDMTLRTLCERFAKRTAVVVVYKGLPLLPVLTEAIQLSFYRFLQEALTNVAKHAQATQVKVYLTQHQQLVSLKVEANGQGFNLEQETAVPHNGPGLLGIRERFEWLGGSLTVESAEKTGTKLIASVTL